MTTVELHIASELLDDFESISPLLSGREVGRRPSPTVDGVTILDMEMANAPTQAETMEVVVRRVGDHPEVKEIHYWDEHGIFLAPVVPFRKVVAG
jgi:hypothetical protein